MTESEREREREREREGESERERDRDRETETDREREGVSRYFAKHQPPVPHAGYWGLRACPLKHGG